MLAILSMLALLIPSARAHQPVLSFECAIKELTPPFHYSVNCADVTFFGHVTRLMTLGYQGGPPSDPYWSGFVYRFSRSPNTISADPFFQIIIPSGAGLAGRPPVGTVTCQWQEGGLAHCRGK